MSILKNDKALVKQFVRINFINNNSSFPNWEVAEERFLLPVIGEELLAMVRDMADDPPVQNPTPEQKKNEELVRRCQAVVAPLAYLIELPIIQTQLTDAGLRTISTDGMAAAHRWEYREIQDGLTESGSQALESLLRFLHAHKDYYTEWTDSEAYKALGDLVFTSGEQFARYFHVAQPHRVFWQLRPLIREVEDFYIAPIVGETFLRQLKALTNPSDAESKALELIRKTVAQTVIVKAIEKLSVQLTPQGFTVALSSGSADAANSGDKPAAPGDLSLLHQSCERASDAYQLQLTAYLNKTATAQVFGTYFSSDRYRSPETRVENPNCKRKIFGL